MDQKTAMNGSSGAGGNGSVVTIEERMHKHIAKKKIWPKEATNPLAGGDGWQPRQKVHYSAHNAHQQRASDVVLPVLSPTKAPATAPSKGAPAAATASVPRLTTAPRPTPAAGNSATATATAAAPAAASGDGASRFTPVKDVIRVGIVPGLDAAEGRKTGLRVVKPLPAPIKNIVKNVRPQKMSDAGAVSKPVGKRVFAEKYKTIGDEQSLEMAVGHKYRGYTVEEKRNGIGAGGDRGFNTVEFSDRFFESGATAAATLKWSPTKQQKADAALKRNHTAGAGAGATGGASTLSATASRTRLGSVSPSKAQQSRAAAEQAAVQAILTRKTFKQKLEEESRAADIAQVSQLPDNINTNSLATKQSHAATAAAVAAGGATAAAAAAAATDSADKHANSTLDDSDDEDDGTLTVGGIAVPDNTSAGTGNVLNARTFTI